MDRSASLRQFYDSVESHIRGLEALGKDPTTFGDFLVPVILEKLPSSVTATITRTHGTAAWELHDLRAALQTEVYVLETCEPISSNTPGFVTPTPTAVFTARTKHTPSKGTQRCRYCSDTTHSTFKCPVVPDVDSRHAFIQSHQLCFNCLGTHHISSCRSKSRCYHCRQNHHSSICRQHADPTSSATGHSQQTPGLASTSANVSAVVDVHTSTSSTQVLLKTAVASVRSPSTHLASSANILFDEGAQRSFICQSLADSLHLPVDKYENVRVSTFGGQSAQVRQCPIVSVDVLDESGQPVTLQALAVPEIASFVQHRPAELCDGYLHKLRLAHPLHHSEHFTVSLLIGADFYWSFVGNDIIRIPGGPTAVASPLGYLLSGPTGASPLEPSSGTAINVASMICITQGQHQDVMDLQRFWSLESMGIEQSDDGLSYAAAFTRDYQKTSLAFKGDHYEAKLPWRDDSPALPTNIGVAMQRTRGTVKRLLQSPDLLQHYDHIISDQLNRGFIEHVQLTEGDHSPSSRIHYLPHHYVKKDSATTPIRIVYDCSCRGKANGVCLNDCLHPGPALIGDLSTILTRFRLQRVAVTADIEKAFLQITLAPEDRDATRFFWLRNINQPDGPMDTYRFKSLLFGATSSPFVLHATIQQHLMSNNTAVSQLLLSSLYVDNALVSVNTPAQATTFYQQATALLSSGGFKLRMWASNDPTLQSMFAQDGVADTKPSFPFWE